MTTIDNIRLFIEKFCEKDENYQKTSMGKEYYKKTYYVFHCHPILQEYLIRCFDNSGRIMDSGYRGLLAFEDIRIIPDRNLSINELFLGNVENALSETIFVDKDFLEQLIDMCSEPTYLTDKKKEGSVLSEVVKKKPLD